MVYPMCFRLAWSVSKFCKPIPCKSLNTCISCWFCFSAWMNTDGTTGTNMGRGQGNPFLWSQPVQPPGSEGGCRGIRNEALEMCQSKVQGNKNSVRYRRALPQPPPRSVEPDSSLTFGGEPDFASRLATLHAHLSLHWALLPSLPIYLPEMVPPKKPASSPIQVSSPLTFKADAIFGSARLLC